MNTKKNWVTAILFSASLILCIISLGVYAATPSTPYYVSPGIYPGAPTYTIWQESTNYFAKDQYGALGFSGTNASDIIINCLSKITTSGKIFFCAGTYIIDTLITVNKRVWFEGIYSESALRCSISDSPMFNVTATGVMFENLYFSGNSKTGSGIMFASGSSYGSVEHCDFYNHQVAISVSITGNVSSIVGSIRDNQIATNDIGIQMYAGSGKWANDWQIENNRIKGNGIGISLGWGPGANSHTLIEHNSIESCTIGLDIGEYGYYSDIVFNRFENCGAGINFSSTLHNTRIQFNSFVSNVADVIGEPRNSTLMQWNYGYNTVKWNNVTVPNGVSTITISHNLEGIPSLILITPMWDAGSIWVSAKTSTIFIVNWTNSPSSETEIYWYARYDFPD